ncbi:site-specific integrase [Paenibacillus sp. 453mf]|uniref:site-specific integrase n=1 Tax=Paenibacillus sp. 453mf TaxID=1761874 RepID=UPI0008EF441B|nr:site-specific integrase [Paenibacillus sp. 453mf]SFS61028.1 Phage integrase, N-terminal SAM-like domain [Paenibacillus sp. 453mf]
MARKVCQGQSFPIYISVYENHIESRIIPHFGHSRIDQIKPLHVLSFFKELEKTGARKDGSDKPLDGGTINYIYRVLKNIFSRATELKVITENPMDGVAKPKEKNAKEKLLEKKSNPQFYDEVEAQEVVNALYKESRKWRLLIFGSMFGGFRRGELLALEWHNVNFEEQTLIVENNIPITVKGAAIEKSPKSIASYRSVDMPSWYMVEMEKYYGEWLREKDKLGNK